MFRTTTSGSTCSREKVAAATVDRTQLERQGAGAARWRHDPPESAAIITHLGGERFPESGLVPGQDHPAERAAYFEWCFFIVAELGATAVTIAKHRFALPEKLRRGNIEPTAAWEYQRQTARLRRTPRGGARRFLKSGFSGAGHPRPHFAWARSARIDGGQARLDAYLEAQWQRRPPSGHV